MTGRRRISRTLAASVLLATTAGVVLTGARFGIAGPIPQNLVPDDAAWTIHVDLEALRGSTFGQTLIDAWQQQPSGVRAQQFSDVLGIDLRNDLLGATVFGREMKEESTGILVTVEGDTGNLEGLMLAAPDYSTREIGGQMVHSFATHDPHAGKKRLNVVIDRGGEDQPSRVYAAYNEAVLEQMLKSADAVEAAGNGDDGTILHARVSGLDSGNFRAAPQHSTVLRMLETLSLNVRETNGTIEAVAEADVVDDQRAEQVRQLVQGMLAMTQLAPETDRRAQALGELARLAKVSRDADKVTLTLDVDATLAAERLAESPLMNPRPHRGPHDGPKDGPRSGPRDRQGPPDRHPEP